LNFSSKIKSNLAHKENEKVFFLRKNLIYECLSSCHEIVVVDEFVSIVIKIE
jgi:hypothetical protein